MQSKLDCLSRVHTALQARRAGHKVAQGAALGNEARKSKPCKGALMRGPALEGIIAPLQGFRRLSLCTQGCALGYRTAPVPG